MDSEINDPSWTDAEFQRITDRLRRFISNPKSLTPAVFEKCQALHIEIALDSAQIEDLIARGIPLDTLSPVNPKRAALVDWLAKTP